MLSKQSMYFSALAQYELYEPNLQKSTYSVVNEMTHSHFLPVVHATDIYHTIFIYFNILQIW